MNTLYKWNNIPKDMERVQRILNHAEFKKSMQAIRVLEADRIFCCHNMEHLLDVSRIAYILNLEENGSIKKDVIYAAGLLHDVGKYLQYMNGTPHHITSAEIGRRILEESGYSIEECDLICQAILTHRDEKKSEFHALGRIIYKADKLSRACYACEASSQCNWSEEKKTSGVIA